MRSFDPSLGAETTGDERDGGGAGSDGPCLHPQKSTTATIHVRAIAPRTTIGFELGVKHDGARGLRVTSHPYCGVLTAQNPLMP
jgi:hypothetical protein